jgi:hypothetical protein
MACIRLRGRPGMIDPPIMACADRGWQSARGNEVCPNWQAMPGVW